MYLAAFSRMLRGHEDVLPRRDEVSIVRELVGKRLHDSMIRGPGLFVRLL